MNWKTTIRKMRRKSSGVFKILTVIAIIITIGIVSYGRITYREKITLQTNTEKKVEVVEAIDVEN
tara:strand:- start:367 stop:561 length:195 start_codon:yes stop_codon:yes gene_type:complete